MLTAMEKWPYANDDQKYEDWYGLGDFMLSRGELDVHVALRLANPVAFRKNERLSQRWHFIQQALKLLHAGAPEICVAPEYIRHWLREEQKKIVAVRPELSNQGATSPPAWDEAELLFRRADHPWIVQVGAPMLAGDTVYFGAWGPAERQLWVGAFRLSLKDRKVQLLGKIPARPLRPEERQYYPLGVVASCLGKNHFFVATQQNGIFAFDLHGGPVDAVTRNVLLPSEEIETLAHVDGKLYASLAGGYLVELDPATKDFTLLASSRRRERLSPFDDDEAFRISYLIADPERQRLLFLLYQRPNKLVDSRPSSTPAAKSTNGLWEYDLRSKKFKRHLELYFEILWWGSPIRDGQVLLAKVGHHNTGVLSFDLATDKGRLLWARRSIGPTLPKEAALSQEDYYPLFRLQMARGDWLWCAEPLSRVSLTQRRQEFFAAFSPIPERTTYGGFFLEPVASDRVLLVDPGGLRLLKMKKELP
jgi:hypothetical protein